MGSNAVVATEGAVVETAARDAVERSNVRADVCTDGGGRAGDEADVLGEGIA
ncbi:MAG: hypothetical protein H6729_04630 [Deltaproteobacteria bacterium]|nr:hypothetical protein [Deltaproteobacteria bacterium]